MFSLTQGFARSRRLGLGIAVAALTLATFASPMSAFAAPVDPGHDPHPAPGKSDLQVIARSQVTVGSTTKYNFLIKNNGPVAAVNFNAYKEAQQLQMPAGPGFALVDNGYFQASLAAGQSMVVTVTCTPPAGWKCTQATVMTLNNPTDPNGGNNMAVINS
jgi:hypothetical protein